MKKEMPLISMVVAVYNGAETIQRCIDSFINQTYQDKELIIIDGGSTDGTVDILKKNEKRISYWESEPDRGICHAWNKALKHVQGDWICFLGSDDFFWRSDVLERVAVKLTEAYPPYRVVYGQIYVVKPSGKTLEGIGAPWDKARRAFCQVMTIPHQAVLHHRSLFDIHGSFDESFRVTGDYEFLLRELKDRDAYFLGDIIIAGMQNGGLSHQPHRTLFVLNEYAQARRKNKISGTKLVWLHCVFRSYMRQLLIRLFGKTTSYYLADAYRILSGKSRLWTK